MLSEPLAGRRSTWGTAQRTAKAFAPEEANWQFTTNDARIKLKKLYPVLDPIVSKLADH